MTPRHACTVVLLAALVWGAMPVQADAPYSGRFLAGEPAAWLDLGACAQRCVVANACSFRQLEGINSNCVALDWRDQHRPFTLKGAAVGGEPVDLMACFFTHRMEHLGCHSAGGAPLAEQQPTIPAARYVAVSAIGGVDVSWTLTVH